MKRSFATGALVAVFAWPLAGFAAGAPGSDDRFTLMASGSTLTDTDGGWGAAVGWLHNFSADTIFGLAGQHQTIGDADWNFGTLNLSHGMGQANRRTTFYAEVNEGSGKDNVHSYDYSIIAAGVYQSFTRQLSLQLEDKQINVDTVRGNLPKLGLQYLWSPKFSSIVSYSHSVSGNLSTRITSLRFDGYGKTMNYFAGAANGQASPVVINLQTGLETGGLILHEYFVGVGRAFSRADASVLLDYVKIGGSERVTLTFNCILHKPVGGAAR